MALYGLRKVGSHTLTHCVGLDTDRSRRNELRNMSEIEILRLYMDIREIFKRHNRGVAHISEMVRTSFEVHEEVPVNPTYRAG